MRPKSLGIALGWLQFHMPNRELLEKTANEHSVPVDELRRVFVKEAIGLLGYLGLGGGAALAGGLGKGLWQKAVGKSKTTPSAVSADGAKSDQMSRLEADLALLAKQKDPLYRAMLANRLRTQQWRALRQFGESSRLPFGGQYFG